MLLSHTPCTQWRHKTSNESTNDVITYVRVLIDNEVDDDGGALLKSVDGVEKEEWIARIDFINILWAAFEMIFFCQKIKKPSCD
jgi:hypothetical protein